MQFNACIAGEHKLIATAKIRRKRRNEAIDFPALVRKASRKLKIDVFLGDKVYNSEANHKLVRHELNSKLIAPLRRHCHKIKGFYRKQMAYLPSIYDKRVGICESSFSSLKRKFGDVIYAKKFVSQKNELLCKVVTYNLDRIANLVIFEIYFLQSPLFLKILKSLFMPWKGLELREER